MIDRFLEWIQTFNWGHVAALGLGLSMASGIRWLDKELRTEKKGQSVHAGRIRNKTVAERIRQFFESDSLLKLLPAAKVLLLFAAAIFVLVGIQEIYAQLNPRGRFSQPEVSWPGAFMVAGGLTTFWIGASWLRDIGRGHNKSKDIALTNNPGSTTAENIVKCPSCGSPNRVRGTIQNCAIHCGKCHKPIPL